VTLRSKTAPALLSLAGLLGTSLASAREAPKTPAPKVSPTSMPAKNDPSFVEVAKCETLPQKENDDLWNLAECYFKISAPEKAAEILREITRKNPQDLEAYFTSSWLLWSRGRLLGGSEERKKTLEALEELQRARVANPTHWEADVELGDFYALRLDLPEKAYAEYLKARAHYEGDYSRNVPRADLGRRASIENRIARTAERLERRGEAVEASCRALFFDPDDPSAKTRLERLFGSCVKKGVEDPRKEKPKK
jgi:tetratricopeptide (TPR) repeat protein